MPSGGLFQKNNEVSTQKRFTRPTQVWPTSGPCRHSDVKQGKTQTIQQHAHNNVYTRKKHSLSPFQTWWQWSVTRQSVSISMKMICPPSEMLPPRWENLFTLSVLYFALSNWTDRVQQAGQQIKSLSCIYKWGHVTSVQSCMYVAPVSLTTASRMPPKNHRDETKRRTSDNRKQNCDHHYTDLQIDGRTHNPTWG